VFRKCCFYNVIKETTSFHPYFFYPPRVIRNTYLLSLQVLEITDVKSRKCTQ
jgi:hypothetical protein